MIYNKKGETKRRKKKREREREREKREDDKTLDSDIIFFSLVYILLNCKNNKRVCF